MTDFATLLQQGNSWLFVPSAILLGALHGLEPGHSKTMMAAFIIAVRGTVGQAVLLALAATLSHTAIVWAIALGGMYFGQSWNAEANEPWLQLASGLMIVAVALWMIGRTWSDRRGAAHPHDHHHDHGHDHHHHDHDHHHHHHHHEPLPAACHHDHHHPVHSEIGDELNAPGVGYQDPHERAHAADIRRRFAGREVTTGQIVIFGLTGGLIPCPASITVLLLCLQLKKIVLGAALEIVEHHLRQASLRARSQVGNAEGGVHAPQPGGRGAGGGGKRSSSARPSANRSRSRPGA